MAIATPGPATMDGVLLATPNSTASCGTTFRFARACRRRSAKHHGGIAVRYLGDGQAAALGEYSIRSRSLTWNRVPPDSLPNETLDSLFMVIVGTGLGGGAVLGGQAIQGSQGRAGHVGHILLPRYAFRYEHDRKLLKGNAYATTESAVSLSGLAHQLEYRLTLREWASHSLNQSAGACARRRSGSASWWRRRSARAAIVRRPGAGARHHAAVRQLSRRLRPAGDRRRRLRPSQPAVRDRYRQFAEEEYRKHALDGFRNLDRFEFSVCGDEAPVVGALAWAMT